MKLSTTLNKIPVKMCWHKHLVFKLLEGLDDCHIQLTEADEHYYFGDNNADICANITIVNEKAYQRILWGGSIGAAEAYVEGLWYADSLVNVIRIFSRNLARLKKYEKRFGFGINIFNRLRHHLNRNSKSGSRTNIAAHYDLSNDMYRLFLDSQMQYSSAIFPQHNSTLEQAQEYKLNTICQRLNLDANDHLLEIGSGWGGLACYAAKHYGCRVTTTTISQAQFSMAEKRINEEGLNDKITLLLEDYRDLKGHYSKIVSIEMIEAIGHKFMPDYFKMLDTLLQPGGKLLIQSITINDQGYANYCRKVDFIQRYIFPGGHLPSVSLICDQIRQYTNMYLNHFADYRLHYANTLKEWRHRFLNNKAQIMALGFSADFIRLWEYYFCYCEGGFRESVIGLAHIEAIKNKHHRHHQ